MLPPTLSISASSCGDETLFLDEDERDRYESCDGDVNKNGVNDCIEHTLNDGTLELVSDAQRYYYHTSGTLEASLYDADDVLARFDSQSHVREYITRVEARADETQPLEGGNIRVIYDASNPQLATDEARAAAQAYIDFRDIRYTLNRGKVVSYFTTKGRDANIYFQAELQAQSADGAIIETLLSNEEKIEIRSDRVFLQSYSVDADGYQAGASIVAGRGESIFIVDGTNKEIQDVANTLTTLSEAKEKLVFLLKNYASDSRALPIEYPIDITITRDGESVFSQSQISDIP